MRISVNPSGNIVDFEPVEITSLDDFITYATKYNYSTGTFKDNHRSKANFLKAESIAIDVDNENEGDSYTMEGAAIIFKDYKHIIMPSRSHLKAKEVTVRPKVGLPYKKQKIAERFRIILFLDSMVDDEKDFTATWKKLQEFYPAADIQCKDASRFYFPSTEIYSKNVTGKNWPTSEYVAPEIDPLDLALSGGEKGQLAKPTMTFLIHGVPEAKDNPKRGNRRLFKACKDMQEQGYTIEECRRKVLSMITTTGNWGSDELSDHDLETIENAYKESPLYAPREGEATKKSAFKFQKISTMMEEAKNIDWLVGDLLVRGGFSIMAGPPKAGKSTLVRQLIKNVCEGGEFLGRGVEPGSVAYLTFEEQPSILKKQFDAIGITDKHDIVIHTGSALGQEPLLDLEEAIEDMRPDLVVIDTLFDISGLDDINSYKAVYDFLRKVRDIARNTDAHILGVHHTNKTGQFLGSQAIFGAVDTMFTMMQQRDRRFLFSSGKDGNHFKDQELNFEPKTQEYSLGKEREIKKDTL